MLWHWGETNGAINLRTPPQVPHRSLAGDGMGSSVRRSYGGWRVCVHWLGGLCGGERTAQPGQRGTEPNEFWNGGKSIFQPNVLAEQKAETIPTVIPTWEHRWGGKKVRAFGNNKFVDRNPATCCGGGYLPHQSLGFRDSWPMPPADALLMSMPENATRPIRQKEPILQMR